MAEWIPFGDRAIRFARPPRSARTLVRAVRAWPGVVDVVVARHDVAAYFAAEPRVDPAWIAALATAPDDPDPGRDIALPAAYNGPDRAEVAAALGRTVDE